MSNRRPGLLALLCVGLGVLLSGCGESSDEPIVGVVVDPRGTQLLVRFSGCESGVVDVEETDEEVTLTVQAPNTDCEPLWEVPVTLDAPVGDRTLVDGATGDRIEPTSSTAP